MSLLGVVQLSQLRQICTSTEIVIQPWQRFLENALIIRAPVSRQVQNIRSNMCPTLSLISVTIWDSTMVVMEAMKLHSSPEDPALRWMLKSFKTVKLGVNNTPSRPAWLALSGNLLCSQVVGTLAEFPVYLQLQVWGRILHVRQVWQPGTFVGSDFLWRSSPPLCLPRNSPLCPPILACSPWTKGKLWTRIAYNSMILP